MYVHGQKIRLARARFIIRVIGLMKAYAATTKNNDDDDSLFGARFLFFFLALFLLNVLVIA